LSGQATSKTSTLWPGLTRIFAKITLVGCESSRCFRIYKRNAFKNKGLNCRGWSLLRATVVIDLPMIRGRDKGRSLEVPLSKQRSLHNQRTLRAGTSHIKYCKIINLFPQTGPSANLLNLKLVNLTKI
jgi:hypothetical protein